MVMQVKPCLNADCYISLSHCYIEIFHSTVTDDSVRNQYPLLYTDTENIQNIDIYPPSISGQLLLQLR